MKKLITILFFLFSTLAHAQIVKGRILDKEDMESIQGVTIELVGTDKKVISNKKGNFVLTINNNTSRLRFQHEGFKTIDTLINIKASLDLMILMEPATAELDEVVIVSSSRTNSRIEDLPTKMEVLGSEEVHEENGIKPGNIASLLGDIAGIQIQQTNAATGNADMRIQGLQGKYTQILRDGMPLFGGYAGSFSILQIPPLDLQQVELVKGASSTLYGGGAIAGMLNLISKKPKLNKFESSLTLNVSDANEKNINIFSAARNNKFGYTFFAGNTTQQAKDANGDGFSDFPDLKSVFVHPRLFIYGKEESTLMLGYTLTSEDRKGGDMQLLKNSIQHEQAFFIQNKILRNTFDANWEKGVGVDGQIVFKSNYSLFNRDITTNIFGLKGQQDSWYNELAYTTKTDKHHVVMGINFNGEDFKKKGLDSSLISNTAASTFGIFGQDDWRFANQWTLQSGIRLDRNKMYGNFLLPRFSLMYKINAQYTMRLGGGLGYKTPSLFNAEMDERDYKYYTGFKKGTESERSTGINYDINFKKKLNGWDLTINQTFFYNNISHPIVLATNKNQFTYFNESKNLESIGFESFIQVIKNPMEFYAGYVYTDAKRNYNSSNPNLPLVAKHKIATVIAFKIDEAFRVGIESSYTGSQNLDNGNKTNPYWIAAIMTKYTIGKCSFVLNCENLFDIKQSNFATIVSGPNSNPIFTELWAPVYGRTLNLSMYAKF